VISSLGSPVAVSRTLLVPVMRAPATRSEGAPSAASSPVPSLVAVFAVLLGSGTTVVTTFLRLSPSERAPCCASPPSETPVLSTDESAEAVAASGRELPDDPEPDSVASVLDVAVELDPLVEREASALVEVPAPGARLFDAPPSGLPVGVRVSGELVAGDVLLCCVGSGAVVSRLLVSGVVVSEVLVAGAVVSGAVLPGVVVPGVLVSGAAMPGPAPVSSWPAPFWPAPF
jgi:hypothetical protein